MHDWGPYHYNQEIPVKAIAFDLGDTLVEYEGVALSWEDHYPDALTSLAAIVSASIGPQHIDAGAAILRSYNTRRYPRTAEMSFEAILSEILDCFELKSGTVTYQHLRERTKRQL